MSYPPFLLKVKARCFYCDLVVDDKEAWLERGTGCVKCAGCVAYDQLPNLGNNNNNN